MGDIHGINIYNPGDNQEEKLKELVWNTLQKHGMHPTPTQRFGDNLVLYNPLTFWPIGISTLRFTVAVSGVKLNLDLVDGVDQIGQKYKSMRDPHALDEKLTQVFTELGFKVKEIQANDLRPGPEGLDNRHYGGYGCAHIGDVIMAVFTNNPFVSDVGIPITDQEVHDFIFDWIKKKPGLAVNTLKEEFLKMCRLRGHKNHPNKYQFNAIYYGLLHTGKIMVKNGLHIVE